MNKGGIMMSENDTNIDKKNTPSKRSSDSPSNDYGEPTAKENGPMRLVGTVLILCLLSIGAVYAYENWRNDQVLNLKAQAETAAFNKQWIEAEEKLGKANQVRPQLNGIKNSLAAVQDAENMQIQIDQLSTYLDDENLDEAKKKMNNIIEQIGSEKNELYFLFKEDLLKLREEMLVLDVRIDIKEPLSMQSLAGKMLEISDVESESAEQVRNEVKFCLGMVGFF